MNMKHLGGAAAAALVLSGGQVLAATIVIDDFNTFQSVTDAPADGSAQATTSTISTPSSIGGMRTLTAENTSSGATAENATTFTSGAGRLSFSNNDMATGVGTLTYSGLNLSATSTSFFSFNDIDFDNDFDLGFGATATDSDGTTIRFLEELSAGFSPNLSFAEFDDGDDLADFNLGDIASLTFFVDSTGRSTRVDGSIGSITLTTDVAPVPLPASGLLLLGGLGGIAALRRRRKA